MWHCLWKTSHPHCSKAMLQHPSSLQTWENFVFIPLCYIDIRTLWLRDCACDKVVLCQYSSVLSKVYTLGTLSLQCYCFLRLVFYLVMVCSHFTGYPFPTAPPVDPFAKIRVDDCGKTKGCFRSVWDKNAGTFTFANADWLLLRAWPFFYIH